MDPSKYHYYWHKCWDCIDSKLAWWDGYFTMFFYSTCSMLLPFHQVLQAKLCSSPSPAQLCAVTWLCGAEQWADSSRMQWDPCVDLFHSCKHKCSKLWCTECTECVLDCGNNTNLFKHKNKHKRRMTYKKETKRRGVKSPSSQTELTEGFF